MVNRDEYDGILRDELDLYILNTLLSDNYIKIPVLFPVNYKSFVPPFGICSLVRIVFCDAAAPDGKTPRSVMKSRMTGIKTFIIRSIFYPHSKKYEFIKTILNVFVFLSPPPINF